MRELMGRIGRVSVTAVMAYRHRTERRDRAIADSLDTEGETVSVPSVMLRVAVLDEPVEELTTLVRVEPASASKGANGS